LLVNPRGPWCANGAGMLTYGNAVLDMVQFALK
jgi:hypothetical protein